MIEFSDDYGTISDSPTDNVDCGGIFGVFQISENLGSIILINVFSYTSSGSCGSIKGKSQHTFTIKEFVPHEDLNDIVIIFFGIILTWIGSGTAFELDNGSERMVSPYLTGGTVR